MWPSKKLYQQSENSSIYNHSNGKVDIKPIVIVANHRKQKTHKLQYLFIKNTFPIKWFEGKFFIIWIKCIFWTSIGIIVLNGRIWEIYKAKASTI